jgi:hypothetical protein
MANASKKNTIEVRSDRKNGKAAKKNPDTTNGATGRGAGGYRFDGDKAEKALAWTPELAKHKKKARSAARRKLRQAAK